ncbi:hypothetical protein HWV62_31349 [Athelia sp. TMB]|nr:hypothetical protein HWV62_31349 [Athelia sp. TMB]
MMPADATHSTGGDSEKIVAVMGPTGSGKTTFINLMTGCTSGVNDLLQSSTRKIEAAPAIRLGKFIITLFDTPGFDDTIMSDTEILRLIASFLESNYRQQKKLDGIIYMHRITDVRVGGISRRNFGMVRKLCGDNTLKNVAIILNMWDAVTTEVAEARENELASEEIFFKGAVDKGAQILRHNSTIESGLSILRQVTCRNTPAPLQIQELVDGHIDLSLTVADPELEHELKREAARHHQNVRMLKEEIRTQLSARQERSRIEICRIQAEQSKLTEMALEAEAKYREERSRREQEVQERAEQARIQAERVEIETQALRHRLADTEISSKELEQMRRQLIDLECRVRLKHG